MYDNCSITELQHMIATKGDERAYAVLFLRYAGSLNRFANSIVHKSEVAEEIVSDVFIRIWEKRESLDQVSNLKMYLFVSVRNYCINYRRSQKHLEVFDLDKIPEDQVPFNVPNPLQLMVAKQLHQRIFEAIALLPPKCRLIFKLAKEDGLRVREIAEILHISPKTVENQLTIAVKKMGMSIREITGKVIRLRS
jgi:RNA polymerase sigma-70 factor (ECF subfamily)